MRCGVLVAEIVVRKLKSKLSGIFLLRFLLFAVRNRCVKGRERAAVVRLR